MFLDDLVRSIPKSGIAKVLSAYLASELSCFPPDETESTADDDEQTQEDAIRIPPEEILDEMIVCPAMAPANTQDGYNMNANCVTAGRIVAAYYLYNKEYESASEISRASLESLRQLQDDVGIKLSTTETALMAILASALIHYQAPKQHPQARKLFQTILTRKSNSVEALVGMARVSLEAGEIADAEQYTTRALQINSLHVEAKMEHAWALVLSNDIENGKRELEETLPLIDGRDPRSRDTIAEIWWRIGKCHWDEGVTHFFCTTHVIDTDDSKTQAYTTFVNCLKYNQNFAPAYTGLGLFYADVANDEKRAYKCFQKAFELDAGEVEAAERLAQDFAKSRQWDLVEVVAKRVLQASRKRLSSQRELAWPHRALGVAELVSKFASPI
jgi:superkiller protein 3